MTQPQPGFLNKGLELRLVPREVKALLVRCFILATGWPAALFRSAASRRYAPRSFPYSAMISVRTAYSSSSIGLLDIVMILREIQRECRLTAPATLARREVGKREGELLRLRYADSFESIGIVHQPVRPLRHVMHRVVQIVERGIVLRVGLRPIRHQNLRQEQAHPPEVLSVVLRHLDHHEQPRRAPIVR